MIGRAKAIEDVVDFVEKIVVKHDVIVVVVVELKDAVLVVVERTVGSNEAIVADVEENCC